MADNNKLTLPLQLVGVTAALVFCFSATSSFNYGRALWFNREVISSLTNQDELFLPLVLGAIVCIASLIAFFLLLGRSVRIAALSSMGYLGFLLLLTGWKLVSLVVRAGDSSSFIALGFIVELLYAAWLLWLLLKVWSSYSRKWIASGQLK